MLRVSYRQVVNYFTITLQVLCLDQSEIIQNKETKPVYSNHISNCTPHITSICIACNNLNK